MKKEKDVLNNETKVEVKKSKGFVPAYELDKVISKDNIKVKKENIFKSKYILLAILLLVVISVIFGVYTYIDSFKYKEYVKYEDKMNIYGFNKMYNNQSAKTSDKITKTEAIKMVISCAFNTYDISGFAKQNDEFKDAIWAQYAKDKEITLSDEINKSNFNNSVKYIDVIRYFENAKSKFLNSKIVTDVDVKLKDINKYNQNEQLAIKDMLYNEIIPNLSRNLNGNSYIFKGQLNELVVNFVEKYNTITVNGEKININPEKMPSNKDDYPYTLASVDKSVYEIPNYYYLPESKSAKELFNTRKDYYIQLEDYLKKYFKTILNVDYTTINKDSFKNSLSFVSAFPLNNDEIDNYIKYVKDNAIKISGEAKIQFPAVYYDGFYVRARTKVTLDVLQSNTLNNLLFKDLSSTKTQEYKLSKSEYIIDVPVTRTLNSNNLNINISVLKDSIAGQIKNEFDNTRVEVE